MSIRGFGFLAALVLVATVLLGNATPVAAATGLFRNQNIASETYYTLDTQAGVIHVEMTAVIQNAGVAEQREVYLIAMPGARDIVVKKGDVELEITTEVTPIQLDANSGQTDDVLLITASLGNAPMRAKARFDFTLSYNLGPLKQGGTIVEAGLIETPFVSQGPGSFVFIDVPVEGQTYVDPGCLVSSRQPAEVQDAGRERYVCGEAILVALASDKPEALRDCAAAHDKCRQLIVWPHSAYAQSITDLTKQSRLEADVVMPDGRTVHMTLLYFRSDGAWAAPRFEVAKKAFPLLEEVFGFQYPHDSIIMRQSHHIEMLGALGIAFSRIGEVLLATDTGIDDYVLIHELAHQWAGNQLQTAWLWEGLAEWGSHQVAPKVGVEIVELDWEFWGYTDPLAKWWNGSPVRNSEYWYGKSGAFWHQYAAAVGGVQNMTAVLSQIADYQQRWPLDGRWFLDKGEEVSGANLDLLFHMWVFDAQTSTIVLSERREAHDLKIALLARAEALGFEGVPVDITTFLEEWVFSSAKARIAAANQTLDRYEVMVPLAEAAGLPITTAAHETWKAGSLAAVDSKIGEQRNAISAITDARNNLETDTEASINRAKLDEAIAAYEAENFAEATRLASGSVANRLNSDAATVMIGRAKAKQASFDASLLEKVGLLWKNPDADLAAAEAALAEGDGTRALHLSKSAYDTWTGAKSAGIFRLGALMAINCLFFAGVWGGLRKVESIRTAKAQKAAPARRTPKPPTGGHASYQDRP